jgi:hypothetical protein
MLLIALLAMIRNLLQRRPLSTVEAAAANATQVGHPATRFGAIVASSGGTNAGYPNNQVFPRDQVWDTLRQSRRRGLASATAEFYRDNRWYDRDAGAAEQAFPSDRREIAL